MEWVEVRGRTVEEAVSLGLQELGLDSPEAAEIEVLKQPQRGFLGIGAQDALVRIKPRLKRRRRHHRSRAGGGEAGPAPERNRGQSPTRSGEARSRGGRSGDGRARREEPRGDKGGRRPGGGGRARVEETPRSSAARVTNEGAKEEPTVSIAEQAEIVHGFLAGLLDAFGLEGKVTTRVEGDIVYADVSGEQTEALIGPKGAILDAVLELCRTMVHRQSQAGARLRLDIGGYGERRREALRIYAGRLAARVLEEGGEVMLEPMNAADRKVVHDVVAEIDGVRSFSEGEDPDRSVVIARSEDAPRDLGEEAEDEGETE